MLENCAWAAREWPKNAANRVNPHHKDFFL
jgi:hypothetical protein